MKCIFENLDNVENCRTHKAESTQLSTLENATVYAVAVRMYDFCINMLLASGQMGSKVLS